jgi:hypothetical protein
MEVDIGLKFIGSNLEICVLAINNTDYFGCDYRVCDFACV